MILPTDEKCRNIVKELDGDPALTQWEADFIASNRDRQTFTDRQREMFVRLMEKYDV